MRRVGDSRNGWLYERTARYRQMHGRRVLVDPPRAVYLKLLWGDHTPAILTAWRFDKLRGWLGEVTALVQASDLDPAPPEQTDREWR